MTNTEALEILEQYQAWRRGADTEMLEPKDIGKAIDVAIDALKRTQWQPIDTAPMDGKRFIAFNGQEMLVLNQPHGCALGRWAKSGKNWYGAMIRFDGATHWMELPPKP